MLTATEFLVGFFTKYLAFHPEEATTLGVHEHDADSHDATSASIDRERVFFGKALERVTDPTWPQAHRLDGLAIETACRGHIHHYEGWHLRNLERSLTPYSTLQYHLAQVEQDGGDDAPVRARLNGISRSLADREALFRRALQEGWRPDADIVGSFIDSQLPMIIDDLEIRHAGAAAAYARHYRFYKTDLQPAAQPESGVLGEEELTWRLANLYGYPEPLDEILEAATASLRECQARILELSGTKDLGAAALVLHAHERRFPSDPSDIAPMYRVIETRARDVIQRLGLFPLPRGQSMGMKDAPAALQHLYRGTNWPAPLLDARKRGWFLISPQPERHPQVWSAMLSLHEGIPGHFLQSAVWQSKFGASQAPVRFLLVADDIAQSRNLWTSMPNIEGWAVYTEEVMRSHGFHEGPQHLAAWVAHAFRAARVVVDLSLHAGRMTLPAASEVLQREALATESNAKDQVLRYLRLPVQASTYWLGRRDIERLRDQKMAGGMSLYEFHSWFLDQGPVHPRWLLHT
jgi:hypothetical protein